MGDRDSRLRPDAAGVLQGALAGRQPSGRCRVCCPAALDPGERRPRRECPVASGAPAAPLPRSLAVRRFETAVVFERPRLREGGILLGDGNDGPGDTVLSEDEFARSRRRPPVHRSAHGMLKVVSDRIRSLDSVNASVERDTVTVTSADENVAPVPAEHRTVSRVMAVLEIVVAGEPNGVRLGDLATPIGAAKSTVHGWAKGLVATGYLREQDGRYFTGPAVFGLLGGSQLTLPAAFHHALEELTGAWGETTFIATLVGDSIVYVDRVDSPRLIRASPAVHTRFPLWPRSAGKCFLAFMEPRRRDAVLRRTIAEADERDRIKAELIKIRESSVGLNVGETDPDQYGVASPIFTSNAPVTMAIALAGPATRMNGHLDEIAASVRSAGAALSKRSKPTR